MHRIAIMFLLSTAVVVRAHAQDGASNAALAKSPMRVSGGVMAGQIVKMVMPIIPAGVSISYGCIMHVIIEADGHPNRVDILSAGNPTLGAACVDAVKQWVYKPYLLNGEPIQVETTVTITY